MSDLYANNDDEAKRRYNQYQSLDPFPNIVPALLNTADFKAYIAKTGMIYPFHDKEALLKSASYGVKLMGDVIYWDEDNVKCEKYLDNGDEFKLPKNSIVFVTLEPTFRVPKYIALRFNLKIRYIHKGILLGTGPLIDPGFQGKLLIPLHNLTANDYFIRGGDPIIWIEFTKISTNSAWQSGAEEASPILVEQNQHYRLFPSEKAISDVSDYLYKANEGNAIASSIPEVIQRAEKAAESANDTAKKAAQKSFWTGVIAIIGMGIMIVVSIFQLIVPTHQLVSDSTEYAKSVNIDNIRRIESLEKNFESIKETIEALRIKDIEQIEDPESELKPSNAPNLKTNEKKD